MYCFFFLIPSFIHFCRCPSPIVCSVIIFPSISPPLRSSSGSQHPYYYHSIDFSRVRSTIAREQKSAHRGNRNSQGPCLPYSVLEHGFDLSLGQRAYLLFYARGWVWSVRSDHISVVSANSFKVFLECRFEFTVCGRGVRPCRRGRQWRQPASRLPYLRGKAEQLGFSARFEIP